MTDWQPIETAPKDGTSILIYTQDGFAVAHWEDQPAFGWSDWVDDRDRMRLSNVKLNYSTHWSPLPEPPAIEK